MCHAPAPAPAPAANRTSTDAVSVRPQVIAWRLRRAELPLLLESTADIVEALWRDDQGELPSSTLKLLYATAISRFVTGLLDTQTDISRLSLPTQTTPPIPVALREIRHRIVHRHLPSLAELKSAAQQGLGWLWEHYWSHLDALLTNVDCTQQQPSPREVEERIQLTLRVYVKERKSEIKTKTKNGKVGDTAVESYLAIDALGQVKMQKLLHLLLQEKQILPVGKKLGMSMEGAYLVWSPFLISLVKADPYFQQALTERMVDMLSAWPWAGGGVEEDAEKEGIHDWMVHIETSTEWQEVRERGTALPNDALVACFTTPTFWTLKLAETLMRKMQMVDPQATEAWFAVLDAARIETSHSEAEHEAPTIKADAMDVDGTRFDPSALRPMAERHVLKKTGGPQKHAGLWRPQPIGWIAPGWERYE